MLLQLYNFFYIFISNISNPIALGCCSCFFIFLLLFTLFSDSLTHSLFFASILQISLPIPGDFIYPISFLFFPFSFYLPIRFAFFFIMRFRFSFSLVLILFECFDLMVVLLFWIAIDMNYCSCWLGIDLWLSDSVASHSDNWMRLGASGCQSQLFLLPRKLYSVCTCLRI